jgi:ferric-dicitrate binding protein FerR (iron transport regulator)
MDKQEAINILEQALNAANLKGVYSLTDIQTILTALEVIKNDIIKN